MFYKEGENYVFAYGKSDYARARESASRCDLFILDRDEDELVTSTKSASCYNCLYRRWSVESFTCMKRSIK